MEPSDDFSGRDCLFLLFFADDLVLFVRADHKNCVAIKDALDTFCVFSSQKVSATKS